MAVSHQRVSIGTTATKVTSDADGRDGQTISIQVPSGGATVFLGGAGVTTASYGYELLEGTSFSVELQQGEALYGVVASSTQSVSVIRQGV
jgi:hypothetical protein